MNLYSLLADGVVILHGLYVSMVILGLAAVLVGFLKGWQWVRNAWFRYTHLAMILIVALESMLGIVCPLTTLENHWREKAGETLRSGSFMAQVVHDLLFYEAPTWMFTWAYCVFAGLVGITFLIAPPRRLISARSQPDS